MLGTRRIITKIFKMVFQSFFGSNKKFCDWSDKFFQFSIRITIRYFFYTFNFPIFFKFALSLNQKVSVIEKLKSNKQSKKLVALSALPVIAQY